VAFRDGGAIVELLDEDTPVDRPAEVPGRGADASLPADHERLNELGEPLSSSDPHVVRDASAPRRPIGMPGDRGANPEAQEQRLDICCDVYRDRLDGRASATYVTVAIPVRREEPGDVFVRELEDRLRNPLLVAPRPLPVRSLRADVASLPPKSELSEPLLERRGGVIPARLLPITRQVDPDDATRLFDSARSHVVEAGVDGRGQIGEQTLVR
jgi:hypothetical protein